MAKREWSGVEICTVPHCQHRFTSNEDSHFVKIVCITRQTKLPRLAFFGGVLCKNCFERVKKLISECRHDFSISRQIGQIFIDELDITKNPFANFCDSCFKKNLPELSKFLLPWDDFLKVIAFFDEN